MAKTYLDELVEYPAKVIRKIGTDPTVISLLLNDPNVDMDSDAADDAFDKYIFDYEYVDNSAVEAGCYICVEDEMIKASSPTIQDYRLYITVVCHKEFMKLDPAKFPGMLGNRRDNVVRYVDVLIDNTDLVGIGRLTLTSVKTIAAPTGFSARELIYNVSDFKNKGVVRT